MTASGATRWAPAERAEAQWRKAGRLARMDGADVARLAREGPETFRGWLEAAARHGSPRAQLLLGQMLLDGAGGPADPAAALTWFERAARAGCAEAMTMAGRCHEKGWGAAADPSAAAAWYERAAEAGCAWGEYNLANLRFEGVGVPQDRPAAVAGWRRAAAQGHGRAMSLLARCLEEGWGTAADPAEAAVWLRRAAQSGYFRAEFNHASVLAAEGKVEAALRLYRSALDKAPAKAAAALRRMLAGHPDPRVAALGAAGAA